MPQEITLYMYIWIKERLEYTDFSSIGWLLTNFKVRSLISRVVFANDSNMYLYVKES